MRAVILSSGPVLRIPFRDLDTPISPGQDTDLHQTLGEVERMHILMTLKEIKWVLSGPNGAVLIPNIYYRTDIGDRWEEDSDRLQNWGYLR